jgi:hypothetical protein
MKKKEATRAFKFSDALLVTKGKEKIAFMKRDAAEFKDFGITEKDWVDLENKITLFSDGVTDVEALGDQTGTTSKKDIKAEQLRVAVRAVMARVVLKFPVKTTNYRKFGTEGLANLTDADLLIAAKRVVRVANSFNGQLAEKGLTPEMLTQITTLSDEFLDLIIDMKIKMGDRDVMQEARVEAANAIYNTLVSYTNTGQSIWATSNVAKFNDYIIYNTPTAEAEVIPPAI